MLHYYLSSLILATYFPILSVFRLFKVFQENSRCFQAVSSLSMCTSSRQECFKSYKHIQLSEKHKKYRINNITQYLLLVLQVFPPVTFFRLTETSISLYEPTFDSQFHGPVSCFFYGTLSSTLNYFQPDGKDLKLHGTCQEPHGACWELNGTGWEPLGTG